VRDALSWFCLGEVLESSDPAAAEDAYAKALKLNPAHADTYLNLGALLCEGKRCAEAVALFDEAVRRYPREALLHFNRAVALEDQGRVHDAWPAITPPCASTRPRRRALQRGPAARAGGRHPPGGAPLQRLSAPAALSGHLTGDLPSAMIDSEVSLAPTCRRAVARGDGCT
jgi:tetratricopeptide (TPR) repeat protein